MQKVIRATTGSYIALCAIWSLLLCSSVITVARHPTDRLLWLGVIFTAAPALFTVVWLRKFRIEVTDEYITYESLFGGKKVVNLSNIATARIKFGVERYRDRFLPPMRLELALKAPHNQVVAINMKVFSRSELEQLLSALRSRDLT